MNTSTRSLAAAALLAAAPAISFGQADVLPDIQPGTIAVFLSPIATGLSAPLYGMSAPGDATRLYVLEQKGLVLVVQNGVLQATPALDISARVAPPLVVTNANDERGLLGLAFHPGFGDPASPGFRTLYTYNSEVLGPGVTYVAPNGATQNYRNVVNEWKMTADASVIDPASRREVISFGKNAGNHNGGTIAFGPDGYAYLALGDGGNANDAGPSHIEPGGNAQNLSTPLGKMLRFDPINPTLNPTSADPVSANGQYRIPVSNPFQGAGQVPEIFALGFRNPYRFAFDRLNGQLIEADVGQNTVEEINRVTIGQNYGWAVKEGDFLFNRTTSPLGAAGTVGVRSPGSPAGLTDPITGTLGTLEYDHGDGISITGGFVYRGSVLPELYGKYIFGDLALRTQPVRADGRLFYADLETGIINEFLLPQFAAGVLPNGLTVHGFGQDAAGELYAMTTNTPSSGTGGIIYTLTTICPADFGKQGGLAGPDGVLDNNDFIVFIDFFFTQNGRADVGMQGGLPGADGLFDNNDFVVFIARFFAGC
jgi:glucose/arabinose dehydrogenase